MADLNDAITRFEARHEQFDALLADRLKTRRQELRQFIASGFLKLRSRGMDQPVTVTAAQFAEGVEFYAETLIPALLVDAFEVALEVLSELDAQS